LLRSTRPTRQADSHFTADNEPQAISDWRDDIGTAQSDIIQWINVATSYQISSKTQSDLDHAAAVLNNDLAKVDADVVAVRGK
jgi:hypothetical protein